MCGRFAMNKETDDLIREFVADGGRAQDWSPGYSIAPTEKAPIVRERRSDEGAASREIELAAWGLRPGWAKPGGPAPINARLETVATNGLFRGAFAGQRALVPMLGYYEWETRPDGKQPHFLSSDATADEEEPLLAAAGLYAARKEGDGWAVTFTVITREARDASGEVHDRMPVFLTPDTWDAWLAPGKIVGGADEMLAMLDRSSTAVAATITGRTVDRRVNNSRTLDRADPGLIAAVPA